MFGESSRRGIEAGGPPCAKTVCGAVAAGGLTNNVPVRQTSDPASVRVRPRHQQHRNLAPAIKEIDVDMPKVRLRPMPWRMIERNECLATIERSLLQISANPVVTTDIVVFRSQPTKDLHRRVPLLTWRLLVGFHTGVAPPNQSGRRPLPW